MRKERGKIPFPEFRYGKGIKSIRKIRIREWNGLKRIHFQNLGTGMRSFNSGNGWDQEFQLHISWIWSLHGLCVGGGVSGHEMEPSFALGRHTRAHILQLVRIQNGQTNIFKHRHWVCISQDLTPDTRAHILQMVIVQNIRLWQKNGTYLGLNDFHSQNRINCTPRPPYILDEMYWFRQNSFSFYGLLWQYKKTLVRNNIGQVNIAGLSQSYCWKEPKRKIIKK